MTSCAHCSQIHADIGHSCLADGCAARAVPELLTLIVDPWQPASEALYCTPAYGGASLSLWVRSAWGLEVLYLPEKHRLVFGRSDAINPTPPDVDLSVFDAQQLGVSRRHALIDFSPSFPSLIDLGSTNGTELNGRRIPAYEAYPLQPNDVICLGKLVLYALL